MAPKKMKGKQSSPPAMEAATAATPWPDVPKQLNNEVAKESTLLNNFSYGGVTKSWRVPPKQCNQTVKPPLPQLSDITGGDGSYDTFFDILFRGGVCWWYRWGITPYKYQNQHRQFHFKGYFTGEVGAANVPSDYNVGLYWWYRFNTTPREYYSRYRLFHFRGYSHGVVIGFKDITTRHYLWDPITDCTWTLPSWDTDLPFKYVALSSSPSATNRCVAVVLTGMCKPAFVFYRVSGGFSDWVKQDCAIVDPYSSNRELMRFSNVIGYEGKFYALSLQGTLVVIDADIDSEPRIAGLGKNRAVPSGHSKHFREYLLESDGEILLVFLISRKVVNVVDRVEVYRLERLFWVKMERLGEDRTLFTGSNCCMCVSSSRVGFRSNCVYFRHQGWWLYDMKTQTISPGLNTDSSETESNTR